MRLSRAKLTHRYTTQTSEGVAERLENGFYTALPHQLPPEAAANGEPWTTWLLLGGRGAGKTRAGAEWVKAFALGASPRRRSGARIALVGETAHDVREVMIEGVSGLLRIHARRDRPTWMPSRKRLEWPNGAVARFFRRGSGSLARPAIRRGLGRRARQMALRRGGF